MPDSQQSRIDQQSAIEWRPLTERTLRDTQARIEQILRLDYDTFVNVSFFLQGRADQFAQQPPTRRKEILGNILGLEAWEIYRERAAERRKGIERELDSVDGRLAEIDAELGEEEPRKAHLAELESQLSGLAASRKIQESGAGECQAGTRRAGQAARAGPQTGRGPGTFAGRIWPGSRPGWPTKKPSAAPMPDLVQRAAEVEAAYAALQKARLDLEKWEQIAGRFREHDQRRQPLLREIEAERARLEQEQDRPGGTAQRHRRSGLRGELATRQNLAAAKQALEQAEARLAERSELEKQIQAGA